MNPAAKTEANASDCFRKLAALGSAVNDLDALLASMQDVDDVSYAAGIDRLQTSIVELNDDLAVVLSNLTAAPWPLLRTATRRQCIQAGVSNDGL